MNEDRARFSPKEETDSQLRSGSENWISEPGIKYPLLTRPQNHWQTWFPYPERTTFFYKFLDGCI